MADRKTLVTFLLDKSGSMLTIAPATIAGVNAYLKGLREGPEQIVLTLLQFDSVGVEKTFHDLAPKDAPDLDTNSFVPRGGTPLIDAAYETIRAVERKLAEKTGQTDDIEKVVICIQTDGQENESRAHTWDQLRELVGEKQALGWQFNFFGVGMDAYNQAAAMGIGRGQTMSYDSANFVATGAAFASNARAAREYAMGLAANTAYLASEKIAAGDVFDVDPAAPLAAPVTAPPSPPLRSSRGTGRVGKIDLTR